MAPSDRERFAIVVNALAAVFRAEATEALLHGYWLGLRSLVIEQVERAAAGAMESSKFMPTPAELRELAGCIRDADRAILAWTAFERAVLAHGGYRSVDFDDPLINATVRSVGGWERCCDLPAEQFDVWLRKDFLRTYEAFCRTGVSPDAAAPLVGIHSRANWLTGYDDDPRLSLGSGREPLRIETGLPTAKAPPLIAKKEGAAVIRATVKP